MKYNLKEIINVPLLQAVLDNFSNAAGMSSIAVTSDGKNITNPSCFSFTSKLSVNTCETLINLHKVVCTL